LCYVLQPWPESILFVLRKLRNLEPNWCAKWRSVDAHRACASTGIRVCAVVDAASPEPCMRSFVLQERRMRLDTRGITRRASFWGRRVRIPLAHITTWVGANSLFMPWPIL
jgi:hypothetical protein